MNPKEFLGQQIGPYQIEALQASGGMAVVYRARHADGHLVALKVLGVPLAGASSEESLRFEQESQTAARLRHPNIVPVLDAGQTNRYFYIALPFVKGETLADLLAKEAPFDEARAARIAEQIAGALAYAHDQGIVHRDVKPSNILLTPDGQALLTDFGVAQAQHHPSLMRSGQTIGTPIYMAPEQAGSNRPVDGRADLYALGVVLYQMVTGRPPFTGNTPQVMRAHVYTPPPSPATIAPVSPAMEAIILRALAKDAAQRFQDGAAMAQTLANLEEQVANRSLIPVIFSPHSAARPYLRWLWLVPVLVVTGLVVWQLRHPVSITSEQSEQFSSTSAPQSLSITALPTSTATPCPIPINPALSNLLKNRGDVRQALGCPQAPANTIPAAWQPFERGTMLWRADSHQIIILGPNNGWRTTGTTWPESHPQPPSDNIPNGLFQPMGPFDNLWTHQPQVRNALGWGVAPQESFDALIQKFATGSQIWLGPTRKTVFILFNDQTYQIESVP